MFILLRNNRMMSNDTSRLSTKQIEHIKTLFETFDNDGDGKITSLEVTSALRKHHNDRSNDEFEYMVRILDLDCDTTVDFSEFLEMASLFEANHNQTSAIQIRQLFRAFDKDQNGVLSSEEIKQLWNLAPSDDKTTKKLTENEMNEMIQAMDINGDGQIDYEEFITLMTPSVTTSTL